MAKDRNHASLRSSPKAMHERMKALSGYPLYPDDLSLLVTPSDNDAHKVRKKIPLSFLARVIRIDRRALFFTFDHFVPRLHKIAIAARVHELCSLRYGSDNPLKTAVGTDSVANLLCHLFSLCAEIEWRLRRRKKGRS